MARRAASSATAVVAVGLLHPTTARAGGPFFIVEVQGGFGEAAYAGAAPGLAYGVSAGATLKTAALPLRWYLLGTVIGRNSVVEGQHQGIGFEADRQEVDLFVSQRTVIPVWRYLRLFVETGIGQRRFSQTLRRSDQLGDLSESAQQLLLVLAFGAQARLTEALSVGLRGEMTPLSPDPDLTGLAAGLQPEPNRLSLFAQVAVHF